ncbi:tape measure protein [Ottowia sp. VDI28]|uniref:tape measure protein n=1 Tax=Ottowia sp. VDI28 TaxID=3133968 RepID=UPI003C2EE7F9
MNERTIDYTIRANSDGTENITRLAKEFEGVGVEAGELKEKAAQVSRQLKDVADQQGAIDSLRELGVQGRNLSNRLAESTSEVERLGAALPVAARETANLAEAEAKAAATVAETRSSIDEMQKTLVDLRTSHDKAARSTDEYKASVAQARSTIDELRQQLKEQSKALADAADATRTAASEEVALQRSYDRTVATAATLSGAVGENRKAMDAARESARSLGIDSSKLAEEQKRVQQAAQGAREGLEQAAAMADRMRQSQALAAQTAQAFREDLRKLGLEGPQAPAGLEQAFRKLGISGVKQAEAAVHDLQVALAQIRNSPDILPADKQAAVTAFKQRVAELRDEAGKAAGASQQLGQSVEGTGTSMATAAHKAAAWTGALIGLQQLKSIAGQVIETGAQFENLQVRLSNLLGSTEKAQSAFAMIKELAASTPFDVAGLTESFVKLTAFGMQPTEAQMRSLSDVAANLGGGTEVLSGVTLALGQAWTKTKLQGEEILQLAERGVPVWDALAKATGRTVPELQRMSEAGLLGRDVISKLIDELGRMNEGASDKLMRTFTGAVANAKDALAEFFDMVAQSGVLDWLTDKVRQLLAEFDRMKQTGELQAKAKEIADAFLNVATMVEAAAQALIDMAPAIELAVKAWMGFKALGMAQALYGIAAGGNAAAASIAATGAASAAAAAPLGAAAVAAGRVATVLRVLRTVSGVGLALGAIELAQEFFRAKRAAEEGDAAVRKALESPPASNQKKKAVEELNESLEKTPQKVSDLLGEFDRMIEKGDKTAEAISKIAASLDLSNAPGIRDATLVLDNLLKQGKITAEQFKDAWQKALKDVDLNEFEVRARAAFDGTAEGVAELQQALDAGLREAIRRMGGDFDVLSGGISKAARNAITDIEMIANNFERLRAIGVDTGKALEASISKAINTADSQKAIDEVRAKIESLRKVLGDKITDGLLDQAAQKARDLGDAADKARGGINSLREATKELGLKTREELDQSAKKAVEAYDIIKNAGQQEGESYVAWQERKSQAAEAMLKKMIEANGGLASDAIRARAAVEGIELAIDSVGRATIKTAQTSKDSTDDMVKGWRGVGGSVDEATAALEAQIAQQEKLNQLKERELQLYLKKWQMDKEQFALNSAGQRVQGLQETSSSIYQKSKSAGLDEETALSLSSDLMRDRGQGWTGNPDIVNRAISDAVLKAAQSRVGEGSAQTPAPSSGRSGTASAAESATTNVYSSTINIGGQSIQIKTADQESWRSLDSVVRLLAGDKGRSA